MFRLSIMLKTIYVFTFLLALVIASDATAQPRRVRNAYIVEFTSTFTRHFEEQKFHTFYRQAASVKFAIQSRLNLTSRFFNGVSFNIKSPHALAAIRALDSVKTVWPLFSYPKPVTKTHTIFSIKGHYKQPGSATDPFNYPPHVMTSVNQLQEMGYSGNNVKIAIVDDGIDYRHPALGGGFGPGYKVSFGYDLVGDDVGESEKPNPDPDPFTQCGAHGTHVAGIIGAESPFFIGVAPNATLGMYRVFDCKGNGATEDVIVDAYSRAAEDGAQIITGSLGGNSGWPIGPWQLAINRISSSGVICTVSAGNDGSEKAFYGDDGSSASGAITVASADSIGIPLLKIRAQFKTKRRPKKLFNLYLSYGRFTSDIDGYPIYTIDPDRADSIDACEPLPSGLPSLEKKILLIKYGQCSWEIQDKNIGLVNAKNVIVFGYKSLSFTSQDFSFTLGIIKKRIARLLLLAIKKKKPIKMYSFVNAPVEVSFVPNTRTGARVSQFSSWYPTNDLHFKPEITAPGGFMLSTVPTTDGGYSVQSGTSMATPYAAGIIALFLSARGSAENTTSEEVRNMLLSTAIAMPYVYNGKEKDYIAPTSQQGLGLVDAKAFLEAKTVLDTTTISLNDTENFISTVNFTITNRNTKPVTYTLSHAGAATFETLSNSSDGSYVLNDLSELIEQYATVNISDETISVSPGSSVTINAQFTIPTNVDASLLPIYSGYIQIVGDNEEYHQIGYVGAAGSIENIDLNFTLQSSVVFSYRNGDEEDTSVISDNETINFAEQKLLLKATLLMPTALLRLDVIGTGATLVEGGLTILDSVTAFPLYYQARSTEPKEWLTNWSGELRSGQTLTPGSYNLVLRALKIFGDPDTAEDYYTWTSPSFIIAQ